MSKPKEPQESWLMLRVSPENRPLFLEAVSIAATLNDLEGIEIVKPEARMAEAHRRILIEWATENRFQMRRTLAGQHAKAEATVQQLDALERDDYRCRRCRHTKLQSGGVRVVLIVNYEMIAPGKLGAAESLVFPTGRHVSQNMITFCNECATYFEALTTKRRCEITPVMLRHIGQAGIVEAVTSILLPFAHEAEAGTDGGRAGVQVPGGSGGDRGTAQAPAGQPREETRKAAVS